MARASIDTLLSLDRYSQIVGISPLAFNQGIVDGFLPMNNACADLWFQYSYFYADKVGREDVAQEIATAERDIAELVGFWPAPKFISGEVHRFPRYHRPDVIGDVVDVRGYRPAIETDYGKFIQAGRRATTELTLNLAITYSSEDGDAFKETATVEVDTDLTNACEIKVYFAGHSGDPQFEIRPARTKVIAGGTFTATFWTWQFIKPELWEVFPTIDAAAGGIDIEDAVTNVCDVADIEVYRVYADFGETSAQFFWEPLPAGTSDLAGELTSQDGVIHVRDIDAGIIAPEPAEYDAAEEQWSQVAYSICRPPDIVKIWYVAGDISNNYRGIADFATPRTFCEPLSNWWAQIIAYLATARLERPHCSCGTLTALYERLRVDVATVQASGPSYTITEEDLRNPLGTRRGEIEAWRKLKHLVNLKGKVALA